jgi:opacity protein-like surface antigen
MQAKQSNDSLKSVREVLVGGDLIHNWEGGQIHPFVGAGLGAYFLQPRNNGSNDGSGSTQFGGSILGGIEFFTSKTIALKAEGRYHIVTKWNGYDPSGFSLTIGLKSYF